jgi:hypothetical protein
VRRIPLIGAPAAMPLTLCLSSAGDFWTPRAFAEGIAAGSSPAQVSPSRRQNTVSGSDTFLAGRQSGPQGEPVDGIQCGSTEQLVVHYHAHLAIFAHGQPDAIPEGWEWSVHWSRLRPRTVASDRSGTCLYWVHVHDQTRMIHMELPANITVTLGDFFDIWGEPLSSTQAGPQRGAVTAFVNGARYGGHLGNIVLPARGSDGRMTIARTPRGWCLE